jgi:hypothetical protein
MAAGGSAGSGFFTGISALIGLGLVGVVVAALCGRDAIVKAAYKTYREQWIRDPLDSVRSDKRLPYREFKYFFCILAGVIGATFAAVGIFRLFV